MCGSTEVGCGVVSGMWKNELKPRFSTRFCDPCWDNLQARACNEQEQDAPGPTIPLPTRILEALVARQPLTARELSKEVGLITAKDVNPHIYALQREGKVETLSKDGHKPRWSLTSNDNTH